MKKTFSKSDFKTGMRVERADGVLRMVYVSDKDVYFCGNNGLYTPISLYDDNLRCRDAYSAYKEFDIVKVFSAPSRANEFFNQEEKGDIIWSREESENDYAIEIDGVQYSESTLRSLIKKATQS